MSDDFEKAVLFAFDQTGTVSADLKQQAQVSALGPLWAWGEGLPRARLRVPVFARIGGGRVCVANQGAHKLQAAHPAGRLRRPQRQPCSWACVAGAQCGLPHHRLSPWAPPGLPHSRGSSLNSR